MSDTVCTIPKKITAVNTFILLGFSDYVSRLAFRSFKRRLNQIIKTKKKLTQSEGEKKESVYLSYILMIPAREFILNIK